MFILGADTYACSNSVEMVFKSDKQNVRRETILEAKGCFSHLAMPEIEEDVDCLIKYDNAPAVSCKGYIRRQKDQDELHIKITSKFEYEQVPQILSRIACLV